jgi:TPR repeat protein
MDIIAAVRQPLGLALPRRYAKLVRVTLTALLMQMAVAGAAVAESSADAQIAFATALRIYRDLAERGDAVSQYALGRMYARGEGVPKDKDRARYWFSMGREQTKALKSYNTGDFETTWRIYRPLAEKG